MVACTGDLIWRGGEVERDPTQRAKSSQKSGYSLRWGYRTSFCRKRKEPRNSEKRVDEMDGGARGEDQTLLSFRKRRGCRGRGRSKGQMAEKPLCFHHFALGRVE